MATITTTISSIPDAGHRGIDARTEFVTKQEAFQDALTDIFVPQINTFRIEANLLASEVNVLRDGTLTLRNETENIRNLANVQTQEQVALATTQAGVATTKASEANNSANQALTYKNQLQGYVIPAGTSYSVDQINTQNSAMTKSQFNALAEERKANRAGSGWDEMGKHSVGYSSVNNGIICALGADYTNAFQLGWNYASQLAGDSKTNYPLANANGVLHKLFSINRSTTSYEINKILLPTAPNIYPYDTVLTAEQIASGVIKHADASNSGLIVNGKFDTDTSGWTGVKSTIASVLGKLRITLIDVDGGAYQFIPTVIGKKYIIELDTTFGTNTDISIRAYTGTFGTLLADKTTTVQGRHMLEFTATATSTMVYVMTRNSIGKYCDFDNIAVFPADAISRSDLVFLELTTSNAA